MAYDPNRPNVATGSGKVTPKKPTKKSTPSKPSAPAKPLYGWQGGPAVHSIPYAQHVENTKVKQYGLSPGQPLDAPFSPIQAINYAEGAAQAKYGPQQQNNQELQNAATPWYNNYIATVSAGQQAQQQYAAPLLATANQQVANAGATAPGLDPNSPQYATDQQAAQGRAALASASASSLAAIPAALNAYLAGAQAVAARDLPDAKAYLAREGASIKSDRGAYAMEKLGETRTNAQNYGLTAATLKLNTNKAAADVDISRGVDPVTGQPLPADPLSPSAQKTQADLDYFNKHGYYPPTGPPKPAKPEKDPDALTPAQQRAADAKKAKHQTDVAAATGKVRNKIEDIRKAWAQGGTVDDTSKPADPVTGKYPTRKADRGELRSALAGKYGAKWVEIMETIRDGKKLTQDQVDYLHNSDKNLRIPREWLPTKKTTSPPSGRPVGGTDAN